MVKDEKQEEEHGFAAYEEEAQTDADIELNDLEEHMESKISELKKKLKACESEKAHYLEDMQRTKADFLNSKRRIEEQLQRDSKRIEEQILTHLLPLVDSFDMAFSDTESWKHIDEKWKTGIEAIYNQLITLLKSYNVTEMETLGQAFNPALHEAVSSEVVTDTARVDTVVHVLQKGFMRDDVVIRPAKVTVGTH